MNKYTLRIINKCNNTCDYCAYSSNLEKCTKKIDLNWLKDEVKKKGEKIFLTIIGGEPTYDIDFLIKTIDMLVKMENVSKVSFTTNGFKLNEELLNFLAKNKTKMSVAISYDGNFIGERIKNLKQQELVKKNIKKYLEVLGDEKVSVFLVARSHNVKDLYSNYKDIRDELKIERFRFLPDHASVNFSESDFYNFEKEFCKQLLFINREMYDKIDSMPMNRYNRLYSHLMFYYYDDIKNEFKNAMMCNELFTLTYDNKYEQCVKKHINQIDGVTTVRPCVICNKQKNIKVEILKKNVGFIKRLTEEIDI